MGQVFPNDPYDIEAIRGMTIAMLGYGSQGRAQALNLRDNGLDVRIGVRSAGRSHERAVADGFGPVSLSEASAGADLLVFALPDVEMGRLFEESIRSHLAKGATLVFAHGFAVHYGLVRPPEDVDVVLVAPMGAGPILRDRFVAGSGVPALIAVHRDATGEALHRARGYAAAIGSARVARLETTLREETESDLFGEQAVLCGGLPSLIEAAFESAVAGGISPEIAYIACLHEVKLIADLLYAKGIDGMLESISQTAEWGSYEAGPKVIGEASRKGLEEVLRNIQSGRFAKAWIEEASSGGADRRARREAALSHPMHAIGRRLRPLLGIEETERPDPTESGPDV